MSKMGFEKPLRIQDEELLSTVRTLPCLACLAPPPSHAHHVTTRKAGGSDVAENVMPLCPLHHSAWHQNPGHFIREHGGVRAWLELAHRFDILDRFCKETP